MQQSDSDDASALNSLSKFTLFETKRWAYDSYSTLTGSRFYITASTSDTHRVLKIDRTDPTTLNVTEDATTYDSAELDLLLRMVQDGNKSQGGLEKVLEFQCVVTVGPRLMISGIVGFVQFTAGWYLVLITKRSVVGLLGGHYSRLQTNARADRSLSLRRNHGMLCQTFHLTPASHHRQQGGAHRTGDQVSHQTYKAHQQNAQHLSTGRFDQKLLLFVRTQPIRANPPATLTTSPTLYKPISPSRQKTDCGTRDSCGITTSFPRLSS